MYKTEYSTKIICKSYTYLVMISFCALELVHTVMGYHTRTIRVCRAQEGELYYIIVMATMYMCGKKMVNGSRTATIEITLLGTCLYCVFPIYPETRLGTHRNTLAVPLVCH